MRRHRLTVLAASGFLALALSSGCTSSPTDPDASASPTATAPSPTATASPTPDAEAAVLDVYDRYWDAVVASQRGNPDPALFADVATGEIVERAIITAKQYQEFGIVREGEPTFSDVSAVIDGDTAQVAACIDNSNWFVPDAPVLGVQPSGIVLTRTGGAWLVTDSFEPADLTCT